MNKYQKGQSMIEYTIVTAAIIGALLMPIPAEDITGNSWLSEYEGQNVMELLTDKIKKSYAAYAYAKSLPQLPQ